MEPIDQRSAIAKLAKINPDYANALSGQNPPLPPPLPQPTHHFPAAARFLMYVIPALLTAIWIMLFTGSDPSRGDSGGQAITAALAFLILAAISNSGGKHILSEANPAPPPIETPRPFTLSPVQIEFLKQYLGNEVILTLRYDIPVGFDQNWTEPLRALLSLDAEEVVDQFIEKCESLYLDADEEEQKRLRAGGHLRLDTDLIEYLVVPKFGRAVYESKIPVFRFNIKAKSRQSIPEHDIEVGDIIEGKL